MRICFYSPDSYGLGHVRRTISLAEAVLARRRDASALLLTGAPRAHYFRYPERCDYLKLPSVTKDSGGRYISRELDLSLDETIRFRSRLILEAASSYRPDLLVVDHSPAGLCGEVLDTLDTLGRDPFRASRLLCMRDVVDLPNVVRKTWARQRIPSILDRVYDRILVYGQRELFDVVDAYRMSGAVARKVEYAGYIPRVSAAPDLEAVRARYAPRTGRLVVVALGGGGDGNLLLKAFLHGYASLGRRPSFEVVAVTGPLMSPKKRGRFQAWARELPSLTVLEYSEDLPGLFAASSFVVSMAGYNTVCELACAGARALLVPRVFPRREQWLRARLLADRGVARILHPDDASPGRLMQEVLAGLGHWRPPKGWGLDFGGLDGFARAVDALVPATGAARRPRGLQAQGGRPS